jgi:hypothetical protein
MNLQMRVGKLEQQSASQDTDVCECPLMRFDVRYYEGGKAERQADARPAEECAVCGRERERISVVYVETEARVKA